MNKKILDPKKFHLFEGCHKVDLFINTLGYDLEKVLIIVRDATRQNLFLTEYSNSCKPYKEDGKKISIMTNEDFLILDERMLDNCYELICCDEFVSQALETANKTIIKLGKMNSQGKSTYGGFTD